MRKCELCHVQPWCVSFCCLSVSCLSVVRVCSWRVSLARWELFASEISRAVLFPNNSRSPLFSHNPFLPVFAWSWKLTLFLWSYFWCKLNYTFQASARVLHARSRKHFTRTRVNLTAAIRLHNVDNTPLGASVFPASSRWSCFA